MKAMCNPSHPGASIRRCIEATGWTVTEAAKRLDMARVTMSRLLNGHGSITPAMALAMERLGWSNADHWMRVQAAYDLAQERLRQAAA